MDLTTALSMILADGPAAGVAYRGEYRAEFNAAIKRGMGAPRVEIHPRFDAWMMGDRFGAVVFVGTKHLHVLMDRSGRVRRIPIHATDAIAAHV